MKRHSLFFFPLCGAFLLSQITSADGVSHVSGVDLGIGRNAESHRPSILVAWRNTMRILEVEVLVRNLGDLPGKGHVWLDLTDEKGTVLTKTESMPVAVPAVQSGGDEGTIIQSKGFKLMNLMFDQLDRMNQRYKLRAHVETEGTDLNPLDNIAVKTFNVDGRALPGSTSFYRYEFVNTSDHAVKGHVLIESTKIPEGWSVESSPKPGTIVQLAANETLAGYITVKTPKIVPNGQLIDFGVSLATDTPHGSETIDGDEWFLVADNLPPEVSTPTITQRPDGALAVNVVAFDPLCGIKEASGVQVAYSLDGGTTFSTRIMAYVRGTFYDKTWFEGVLGPFVPGTNVKAYVTVANNAGITKRLELDQVQVKPAAMPTAAQNIP